MVIRAHPSARADAIRWDEWRGTWVISVSEPPTGGRANRAILEYLARRLDVPLPSVQLIRGETSVRKAITIRGLSEEEVARRLAGTPGRGSSDRRV
ncbi:MAG: DUF167 domain-containing protein [Thermoplasmata archaeon]|nr:DUF167 domain-containing protein [Thermoplasmata archaeon]